MKLLHLEDNAGDAELAGDLLRARFPDIAITLVNNQKDFLNALLRENFDVVLADFALPNFSGEEALKLTLEHRPEVPFIFLSGAVGEDSATALMRQGAADYLLKDRIQRLPHSIERARREAEEQLQRYYAEELIHEQAALLEKTRDGIVVTDLAYGISFWNHGAERIFGWSSTEAVGQSALVLLGRGLEASVPAIEKHLASEEEWRGELSVNDKAGRPHLIEIRITLIRDPLGQPKSCLSIIEDITERRKLEEHFLHAQRLESLRMLATGVAHDLNNALAPILMAGEILRARVADSGDQKLLDLIGRSGERSAAIMKQIVSFASGNTSRETVLVQPKHLLNEVFQLMQETFPKSIRLESEIPSGLWTVRGSPSQLHQLLINLCVNARDAMPHGGALRLTARNQTLTEDDARDFRDGTPGPFVVFEVSDTGAGMPEFVIEHIWQPFSKTKAEATGTGLTLPTVRGIAVGHNGFVHVKSEMGRGATFQVFLPAAEILDTGAPVSTSAQPFEAPRGTGELVLVVDDEEGIRESVSAVLRQNGYRPLTTSDGIQALAQYAGRLGEISLVISDLDMPGLGGVAFSKAILRLSPATKILFISGAIEPPSGTASAAFLGKPFKGEALLRKIRELIPAPAKSDVKPAS